MSRKTVRRIEKNILENIEQAISMQDEAADIGNFNSSNTDNDSSHLYNMDDISFDSDWDLNWSSDDDENSSCDEEITTDEDVIFRVKLGIWCVNGGITRDNMDEMLGLLRDRKIQVPKSTKTLLHTPTTKLHPKGFPSGQYFYFGIENMLTESEYEFLRQTTEIILQIGFDGLPLYKSSLTELWPILGRVIGCREAPIILIAVFVGVGKPEPVDLFFEDFVEEVQRLETSGVLVTKDQLRKKFSILNFVGDAPARAFGAGRRGHTCGHGCHMCDVIALQINRRLAYDTVRGLPRTDEGFALRLDPEHHLPEYLNNPTKLEIMGFGMVSRFPVESLHLLDSGPIKKYLKLLLENHCHGFNVTSEIKKRMEAKLLELKGFMSNEFPKKARTLKEVPRWKATEFRQFGLYLAVVVFRNCLSDDLYNHFMHLTCAYRLISNSNAEKNAAVANQLLERFVVNWAIISGEDRVSYNIHNLLHICECVERYGEVNKFAAYPFENFLQILKKYVRKPNKILQQIYNRVSEICTLKKEAFEMGISANDSQLPFLGPTSTSKQRRFDQFVLEANYRDAYCQIFPNIKFEIHDFAVRGGEEIVIGRRFRDVKPFFETPMNSMDVGIFECNNLNLKEEAFPISFIQHKFVNLPYENSYILISLHHT